MKIIGRLNQTIVGPEKTTKIAVMAEHSRQKRLYREQWALKIALSRNILVPPTIDYHINKINGKEIEILILKTIKGEIISFHETAHNIKAMYLVGCQLNLLNLLGEIGFGWPHPETLRGEFKSWESFLIFFVQKYGKRLLDCDIISCEALDNLLRKITNFSHCLIISPSLIHRDIKPANILYASNGPYILDWENALLGDSLFDVAQYGANYGKTKMWQSLADGFGFCIDDDKYALYEAIALIGVIDFYRKQKLNYSEKKRQLYKLLA